MAIARNIGMRQKGCLPPSENGGVWGSPTLDFQLTIDANSWDFGAASPDDIADKKTGFLPFLANNSEPFFKSSVVIPSNQKAAGNNAVNAIQHQFVTTTNWDSINNQGAETKINLSPAGGNGYPLIYCEMDVSIPVNYRHNVVVRIAAPASTDLSGWSEGDTVSKNGTSQTGTISYVDDAGDYIWVVNPTRTDSTFWNSGTIDNDTASLSFASQGAEVRGSNDKFFTFTPQTTPTQTDGNFRFELEAGVRNGVTTETVGNSYFSCYGGDNAAGQSQSRANQLVNDNVAIDYVADAGDIVTFSVIVERDLTNSRIIICKKAPSTGDAWVKIFEHVGFEGVYTGPNDTVREDNFRSMYIFGSKNSYVYQDELNATRNLYMYLTGWRIGTVIPSYIEAVI